MTFVVPLASVRVLPPILLPICREFAPEDPRLHEGADVYPHAVVRVRVPSDGLFEPLFPPDVYVARGIAFLYFYEASLEVGGGGEAEVGSGFPRFGGGFLRLDPRPELRV